MKFLSLVLGILLSGAALFAQTPAPNEFQLTRITRNLITTRRCLATAARNDFPIENTQGRWVEVEAEFVSVPELTDELTFKYFILFNGKLFTGEVTHINIPAGRTITRSSMWHRRRWRDLPAAES